MKLTFGAMFLLCIWNGGAAPKSHPLHSRNRRNVSEATNTTTTTTETTASSTTSSSSSTDDDFDVLAILSRATPAPEKSSVYGSLDLPENYDKMSIPTGRAKLHMLVYVSLFVRTVSEVDEKSEEITLEADFGLKWKDYKIYLYYQGLNWTDPRNGLPLGNKSLNAEFLSKIWKPDVFIDQMVDSSLFTNLSTLNIIFGTSSDGYFTEKNWNNGDFIYSARTTIKLSCDMDFKYYPADTQTCVYHFRSYTYPKEKIELRWRDKGIFLDDPSSANFDIQLYSAEPAHKLGKFYIEEKFDEYRRGNYSGLKFVIKFRRNLSYHVAQTYVPSTLLILITWLCFILPSAMVEARIGISMTTLLTLTAMFGAVRQQSPEVSYSMAIDVWMVFCIFFVFSALLLFASMYWMKMRISKLKGAEGVDETITKESNKLYSLLIPLTKKFGFITFAAVFVLFSISYWALLFYCSDYFGWEPRPEFNADADVDEGANGKNLYLYHEELGSVDSDEDLEVFFSNTGFEDELAKQFGFDSSLGD